MSERGHARAVIIERLDDQWRAACRKDHDATVGLEQLPSTYFAGVSTNDLRERTPEQLFGALRSHWRIAATRMTGQSLVRAFSPDIARHGWDSPHSVLQVVTDDMAFLVNSIVMAARRLGIGIELVVHPLLAISRDGAGAITAVGAATTPPDAVPGGVLESFIHVELERTSDPNVLAALTVEVERTLANVRTCVGDWQLLRARTDEVASEIRVQPHGGADPQDVEEAAALLDWVRDDHFVLLGAADYTLDADGLTLVPSSGLGVLRDEMHLDLRATDEWDPVEILLVTKSEAMSLIHRPTQYDVLGIKHYDETGTIVGERRIIGLFTSEAYLSSPTTIPLLRRKVAAVLARSGFSKGGHAGKELKAVLEGYPRDELFAASIDQLSETGMGVVQLQERRRVRLFARRDVHRRVWTALVYLPRDRYSTEVRRRIETALLRGFGGFSAEYTTALTESSLARLHYVIHLFPLAGFVDVDLPLLEEQITEATRSWGDGLLDALVDQCGDERARALFAAYGEAFPAGYTAVVGPRTAVADIVLIERMRASAEVLVHVQVPLDLGNANARLKVFVPAAQIDLADLLPMLANLGVRVLDENATPVQLADGTVWIHDLGVTADSVDLAASGVDVRLHEAFVAVWRGRARDDGFNRLVLRAGLTWREVHVLRAYSRYLRQLSFTFSQEYVEGTLLEQAPITRALVELFRARFDPTPVPAEEREARQDEASARIQTALESVASLDQDRILRAFQGATLATVRTNWFQTDDAGAPRPTLALKIETGKIPEAPLPRPRFEISVNSPRVEGVHLRMSAVARGGIRWSERPEDFRTEVLGLMKAQEVKNAVIVPSGAKGGFVVRAPFADRQQMQDEVVDCYRLFIGALLDLTDNLVGGQVVAPPMVVRHDGDDPYLVVAADKGTATFSDIANEIATSRGFWLGDAFASGGSAGYDHKAMGITARGAWESVKMHLHRLGRTDADPFTVVGIGDMSGDVFGNGMLLSPAIRLVAAFDHRHVFLDPEPDAGASFGERQRLFALPRSSWDDFDRSVISDGGGVYPRSAKSIDVSAAACDALGIPHGGAGVALAPTSLITAILRAPVDLLWNGGIGTYVKASTESHVDAGDRANDVLRVNADGLRCRIVGEGGNLGLTQRARVEFARNGGLVNTDAIDNSAGVDTSDHEVNLKILLDQIVADGDLTAKQRNAVLVEMTQDVAVHVLADNIGQNRALVNAVNLAPAMLDVHARYIAYLEQTARLDRDLEALPDAEVVAERKAARVGLTVPELAVLLAHTKLRCTERLLAEDGADDPAFHRSLLAYFPPLVRERFADRIDQHPLRREIIATAVVNAMVNHNGITFAFRMFEETQSKTSDIVRAHMAATGIFDADRAWSAIGALPLSTPEGPQVAMFLEVDRLVERASRWVLRNRRLPVDVENAVVAFHDGVAQVEAHLLELLPATERSVVDRRIERWVGSGIPAALASHVARMEHLPAALDIVRLAQQGSPAGEPWSVDDVAAVYFAIDDRLGLGAIRERILALPRDDRWDALARAALRDDLATEHAALTAVVLAADLSVEPRHRLDSWTAQHPSTVDRHLAVTREIQECAVSNIATMSVVLRELRTLAVAR